MHDCMQYNLIQGQGHEPFKGGIQKLSPPPFTMGAGSEESTVSFIRG